MRMRGADGINNSVAWVNILSVYSLASWPAFGAYSASQALEAAAQTTFDSALAAYRNGVGSITDLTLAETQLLQAKNASTDAYSTALSAAATLALATGGLGAAPQ